MSDDFTPDMKLTDAHDLLMKRAWTEAVECPCCNQTAKVYGYNFTVGIKAALWVIAKASGAGREWVKAQDAIHQIRKKVPGVNNYDKLKHWGLLEKLDAQDPEAKNKAREEGRSGTGMWRPTTKGWMFLAQKVKVNSKIFVYADSLVGRSDEIVGWDEVGKEAFDWNDIMGPALQLPADLDDDHGGEQLALGL